MVHIDEGFDFLGFTIRRQRKRGTQKHYVYTRPSRKPSRRSRTRVKAKTYRSTRHMAPDELLTQPQPAPGGMGELLRPVGHGVLNRYRCHLRAVGSQKDTARSTWRFRKGRPAHRSRPAAAYLARALTGAGELTIGMTGTPGSEGAPGFAQSSAEPKGLRDEPACPRVLWAVLVLGFAGTGAEAFGGGVQELACDGRVADGGGVVDAEHGGEVEGVGAAGEGFLELPVSAQALEGGGEAAACLGQPVLADRPWWSWRSAG